MCVATGQKTGPRWKVRQTYRYHGLLAALRQLGIYLVRSLESRLTTLLRRDLGSLRAAWLVGHVDVPRTGRSRPRRCPCVARGGGEVIVSVNDVLTLVVAAAAVAVPLAAVFISNHVDERATRSTLTDLTLKISKRTAAYDDLAVDKRFAPGREIETLVLQAEFLMRRLTARRRVLYPQSSVATTLAMALDKVNDFWWSDNYLPIAVEAAEGHFKVLTCSYWGAALCRRGAFTKGRDIVNNALKELSSDDADTWIVKADACLNMAQWDNDQAANWLDRAKQAYKSIPEHDRHEVYAPHGVPVLNLQGFNFSGANLKHVNLAGANLTEVNLAGADLTGANLTNANLTDANLADTILTRADLNGAIINQTVEPPDGWELDNDSGRLMRASVAST